MKRINGFVNGKHREWPGTPNVATHTAVTGSMESFAPALRSFAIKTLASVKTSVPTLRYPYEGHPFAALTFNIGPAACTKPHKDLMNLSWGWCAVTSLGCYDHKKGGHLILWDLKLAVEFPPYSTIFIPSAILTHSNASVGPTEHRSSITQYNSSGLFRWVAFDHSLQGKRIFSGKQWWDRPVHMFTQAGGNSGDRLPSASSKALRPEISTASAPN